MNEQALWLHEQHAILNMLREAGIDPFKTKMHFKLNKLREEIRMERIIQDYLKCLEDRIDWLRTHLKQPEHFVDNGARCRTELSILRTITNDILQLGEDCQDTYWRDKDC